MATILSIEGKPVPGIYELVIDEADELQTLTMDHVKPGSKVLCIENSKTYMMDSSGTWSEVNFKRGSGGGGGASNIVTGTFTTGSTRNTAENITIPYSGSGHATSVMVYVCGGMYNDTESGNTIWYNSMNMYDIGFLSWAKNRTDTTPKYSGFGSADRKVTICYIYKNSTTSATSYTAKNGVNISGFADVNASGTMPVIFKGDVKTLSYYIGNLTSDTIGLAPSTKYAYIIVYSS